MDLIWNPDRFSLDLLVLPLLSDQNQDAVIGFDSKD